MNARYANLTVVVLILATVIASLLLYPYLPEQLPIHWDWKGHPDGWADKGRAAFLVPDLLAFLLILMNLLPVLSPKKLSIEPFADTYYYIFAVLSGMTAHIHGVMLLCGMMPDHDFSRLFLAGMFLFFGVLGNVLGRVRRNLWMGIRTPWTLASDTVWIATHRLAARLLFGAGFFCVLLVVLGVSPAFCLALLVMALVLPVIYSFMLYRKSEKKEE